MCHSGAMPTKRLVLDPEEELARRTLDVFKRLRDLSDAEIAEHVGLSREAIQQRRKGHTRIHPHRDVPRLAEALGVDPACFYMDDGALLDWIENKAPDLLKASTGCVSDLLRHHVAA